MNHSFLLKHYGSLSVEEQNNMTFEDRKWWLDRIEKEQDKQNRTAQPDHNHTPGQPPI